MAEVVAGLLTSAIVKIAGDKLSSAIAEQGNLAWNFNDDLQDMKDTMESMAAVLKDAEKQSVTKEQARLWLKRLKNAAQDISDMMDDYQDPDTQWAEQMSRMFSCLTAGHKKMVLANEMKNMRETLRKINEQGRSFNFTLNVGANPEQQHYDRRETASAVNEADILGRDGEKKEIIDILSASLRKDGTMLLPIYGLGGVGKSTLGQLVYNDTQFKQYEHRAWVYVSQEFDLKKIGRSIISQISRDAGQQNLDELQMIRHRLDNLLPGKKILIVLDDIWEENALELDKLKHMLHVEKKGSMVDVLVTTRSESIAKNFCTDEPHKLQPLKDDVCWDIIKRYSGFEHKSNKEKLEQIGLDIAKKCRGVALAAKALGYILNTEDLAGWSEINKNNIWNNESTEVLPSLRLSYERMLPILRLCFSYCAIFPKGHDINEDDLIYQWISLDFIKKPSDGKKYIKQLLGMSFLQYSIFPSFAEVAVTAGASAASRDKPSAAPFLMFPEQFAKVPVTPRYTMHDLVHELATSVLDDEDELIVIDAAKKSSKTREQEYCRYAVLTNYDGRTKLSNILPKKVRALHFSSSRKQGPHDGSFSFPMCLRVLDFSGCSGIILPSSTGQLNQLKCLIAPKLQNKRLPDSIVQLTKLQHLNLRGSSLISALPESFGKLSGLTYLCLSGCSRILKVPDSLGGLKSLVHLDMSYCLGITVLPESLGGLKSLVDLDVSHCSGITVLPESLGGQESLVDLDIEHCSSITVLPESLGGLKSLVRLNMLGCSGITVLPESLAGVKSLVHLRMPLCSRISILPESLGGLKSLVHLDVSRCSIISILPESLGGLKSLVHLDVSHCSRITVLPESLGGLRSLVHLDISYCFKISVLPESLGGLKSLVRLDMAHCGITVLSESLDGLKSLVHLNMLGCSKIGVLPESLGELKSLVHLDVSYCSEIIVLPESLGGLKSLVDLEVSVCSRIIALPESLGVLKNLVHLDISRCSGITILPESLGGLISLVRLDISYCSGISVVSESLGGLKSLVGLYMAHCYGITVLPESLGGLKSLVCLDMSYCSRITALPESLGGLKCLMHLYMEHCYGITVLPESLGELKSLVDLDMSNCSGITVLPESIGGLKSLVYLDVSWCSRITVLPESLGHLINLQYLYLSACSGVKEIPKSLGALSQLQRLDLSRCNGITRLPEAMGSLINLQYLNVSNCENMESLPDCISKITTLKCLLTSGIESSEGLESDYD